MSNLQQQIQAVYDTHLRNKNVVMSNVVTRSAQGLSLAEKRIIFCAIAKMSGKYAPVKITAQEYASTFGMPLNQAYQQLKDAAENFFNRYISLSIPDRKGKKPEHWKIRWLGAYGYQDGEGYVSLGFTPEVTPYLCDLESNFTKYKLSQSWALRSGHSWRLLELFEQMRKTNKETGQKLEDGWLSISIEDFWHAMEATETYRKNFKDLRVKIIEPAIKELTEKDNWLIDWHPVKKGRRVAKLEFYFKKDDQLKLQLRDQV
ncbi:replication initiation protein [Escherichia coli]|nr:replication initiation protein [Escherichia coli]